MCYIHSCFYARGGATLSATARRANAGDCIYRSPFIATDVGRSCGVGGACNEHLGAEYRNSVLKLLPKLPLVSEPVLTCVHSL
jgi:hypothetical protein